MLKGDVECPITLYEGKINMIHQFPKDESMFMGLHNMEHKCLYTECFNLSAVGDNIFTQ
jgi:hypothetical protein